MLKAGRARQRVLITNVERIGRYLVKRDRQENATEVDGKSVKGPAPFALEAIEIEDETNDEEEEVGLGNDEDAAEV
jgi:hypothetical protein